MTGKKHRSVAPHPYSESHILCLVRPNRRHCQYERLLVPIKEAGIQHIGLNLRQRMLKNSFDIIRRDFHHRFGQLIQLRAGAVGDVVRPVLARVEEELECCDLLTGGKVKLVAPFEGRGGAGIVLDCGRSLWSDAVFAAGPVGYGVDFVRVSGVGVCDSETTDALVYRWRYGVAPHVLMADY